MEMMFFHNMLFYNMLWKYADVQSVQNMGIIGKII